MKYQIYITFVPSLDIKNVPVKLVSITAFHPLRLMSLAMDGNWPPPLLTKKSIFLCSWSIEVIAFLQIRNKIMIIKRKPSQANY